MTEVEGI